MAASDGALGAIWQESTLVLRYTGQFLGERDCDILDRSAELLGSVIRVEGTPYRFGRIALANLRGQTFDVRDQQGRCVRRIEGPSPDHENSVIVMDPHGTEVVAIKRPDKLGLFDLLRAAIGRSRFHVEAGGQRLGSMTLDGQVYDTANNQVVRLRRSWRVWRTPEYVITFMEPLHEELRVVAIAAAMLQQGRDTAPRGGSGDAGAGL